MIAACNRTPANNETAEQNLTGPEVTATTTGSTTEQMGATNAPGTAQPSDNDVSSGMPVPGTNTPEHIVVNEDANRS
jgi:hypothetical protein